MAEGNSAEAQAWVTVEQVDRAARACMRHKGSRRDALAFRLRYGEEVLALTHRLANGTYRPEPGFVFVTDRPKLREVHASVFRDRVVHHLLHELLAPRFETTWSSRTFACRKGFGTHAAVRCLQKLVHDESRRGSRQAWALQLDIASFFPSVHKPTLLRLLGARFTRSERGGPLFSLVRTVVDHDPTRSARRCGRLDWFERVPLHKRLGHLGPEHGLPIGNLTSQFFAGVYLAPLDHFIQRTLGFRAYVRYMDDLVVVHTDRARLEDAHARIASFLSSRLHLTLRADGHLQPVSQGIDFVGYVVRPTYSLVRRRVFHSLRRLAKEIERSLAATVIPGGTTAHLAGLGAVTGPCVAQAVCPPAIESARATWASFVGHIRHARGRRWLLRCWAAGPSTRSVLSLGDAPELRVRRRFPSPTLDPTFPAQLGRLRSGLRGSLLLVQVGRRWECHSPGGWKLLGLRWWIRRRRQLVAFVPAPLLRDVVRRALARNVSLALAVSSAAPFGSVAKRQIGWELSPLAPVCLPP